MSEDPAPPSGKPPRTRLSRILAEHPEARPRLKRAVGSLAMALLATLTVIGGLLIWHLRRRAALLRDRLNS